jgi:hypothetical protein
MNQNSIDERKIIRRIAVLSGVGALLVWAAIMGSPMGKSLAMPGPLSTNHAHLRDQCEACHVNASDAFQSPLNGIQVTSMERSQSQLCLKCHGWGEHATLPHGWSVEDRGERQTELGLATDFLSGGVPLSQTGELACSTCHQEHRGREHRLAQLEDARCQVCHQTQFPSFEDGHPEFSQYPQMRRTNLIFDHAEHILKHFRGERQGDAPKACTDCHQLEPSGRRMPVQNYQAACSACHDDDIRGEAQLSGAGTSVFVLPALDTLTLEDNEIGIGQWPADSEITEVPLTPYLKLLLSAKPELQRALELLADVDLLDLSDESPANLQAVSDLAWGIKSIYSELEKGGHAALLARLQSANGGALQLQASDDLLAGLPEELVSQALRLWLPDLEAELAQHAKGEQVPTTMEVDTEEPDVELDERREHWVQSGGWYLQGLDFALRYRPVGHADPFYRAWLDLSASGGEPSQALFEHLARPNAEGMCIKCHSYDDAEGRPTVRWNDGLEIQQKHAITRFSHASHFAMATDNTCALCHQLNSTSDAWDATYLGRDASVFVPGFLPMQAAGCASCHREQGAPSDCLTCHKYHPLAERQMAPGALLSVFPLDAPPKQDAQDPDGK